MYEFPFCNLKKKVVLNTKDSFKDLPEKKKKNAIKVHKSSYQCSGIMRLDGDLSVSSVSHLQHLTAAAARGHDRDPD